MLNLFKTSSPTVFYVDVGDAIFYNYFVSFLRLREGLRLLNAGEITDKLKIQW